MGVGAPDCFVGADDVAGVGVGGVDDGDQDLFFGVGEGAEVAVVAGVGVLVVELAELGLVAGRVVQLLDLVVGPFAAAVALLARNVTVVVEVRPSPVLLVVVVQAHLPLVLVCIDKYLPVRLHRIVLNEAMSKRKNSPCSKKDDSPLWSIQQVYGGSSQGLRVQGAVLNTSGW